MLFRTLNWFFLLHSWNISLKKITLIFSILHFFCCWELWTNSVSMITVLRTRVQLRRWWGSVGKSFELLETLPFQQLKLHFFQQSKCHFFSEVKMPFFPAVEMPFFSSRNAIFPAVEIPFFPAVEMRFFSSSRNAIFFQQSKCHFDSGQAVNNRARRPTDRPTVWTPGFTEEQGSGQK